MSDSDETDDAVVPLTDEYELAFTSASNAAIDFNDGVIDIDELTNIVKSTAKNADSLRGIVDGLTNIAQVADKESEAEINKLVVEITGG